MSSIRLAKYKGSRLVEPRQDASKYVVIDEVITQSPLTILSEPAGCNSTTLWEPKFKAADFLTGSALMQAFMNNFKEYRCRAVEITLESTQCGTEHYRVDQAIYWVPNHFEYDNATDTIPTTWTAVLEKDRVSRITRSGGRNIINLHYIPQMVYQDDIDEDEDPPNPDNVFQVRGDFKSGWMPTGAPYTTLDLRGPVVIFRRPYVAAADVIPVVAYCINIRCLWEFRNAKADV